MGGAVNWHTRWAVVGGAQGGLTAGLLLIHAPNATIVQYMQKELGRKAAEGGTREGLTPSARCGCHVS